MNCVHGLQLNIVKMLKCFSPKKSADLMQYQKSKDILFIYFLKRVEFNLYLQDTARYEIPHRNTEIRNRLRGEASHSMYSLELFKYSFVVQSATVTNHI